MAIEQKLSELNFSLPVLPASKGIYKKCIQVGTLLYVSGHVSVNNDVSTITVKVGKDLSD